MMATLKRWASDTLAGGAAAVLGLAVLVGSGAMANETPRDRGDRVEDHRVICALDSNSGLCTMSTAGVACAISSTEDGTCKSGSNSCTCGQ